MKRKRVKLKKPKQITNFVLIAIILFSLALTVTIALQSQNIKQSAQTTLSPSGQSMPVGDLPGWKQIFTDDFTTDVPVGSFPGIVYGSKWTVYSDGTPDTAGQQGSPSEYYPSKTVSIKGGILNVYDHTESGKSMSAAIIPKLPSGQTYGKYTVLFRADSLPGFKTAWLLWPEAQNYQSVGEIDFPEGDLNSTINAYLHHPSTTGQDNQDAYNSGVTYTSWHTASTEWTPTSIKFILDGKLIGNSTSGIPNKPMDWIIQSESCLDGCPAPTTAGNIQIDWVVAYTYSPSTNPSTPSTPSIAPTSPYVTPTFACAGGVNCVPSTMPTINTGGTSIAPSINITNTPLPTNALSNTPLPSTFTSSIPISVTPRGNNGNTSGIQGIITLLLNLLEQLLNLLKSLLGGN